MTRSALVIFIWSICFGAFAQEKHSLIVALSNYWDYRNWNNISSNNDAQILHQALTQNGFAKDNVRIVEDVRAKSDLIDAITDELLNRVESGDIAHFHYSGHGQQVADYSGDEVDGYDEALVPLAAPSNHNSRDKNGKPFKYNGEEHLTDDELAPLLDAVRKKLGPDGVLLVTIDACHSGSSTRSSGAGVARGSVIRIEPKEYSPKPTSVIESGSVVDNSDSPQASKMVVISASSSQELNYEIKLENGKRYGPLSYGLASALCQGETIQGMYSLISKVRQVMAEKSPNQSPSVQGLDNYAETSRGGYFKHNITGWKEEGVFSISSGYLMGITEGSMLEGEAENGKIWRAKVEQVQAASAVARVIRGDKNAMKTTAWMKLFSPNFKSSGIRVCSDGFRKDDLEAIKSALGHHQSNGEGCDYIASLRDDILEVRNRTGRVLLKEKPRRDANGQLTEKTLGPLRDVIDMAVASDLLIGASLDEEGLSARLEYVQLFPKPGVINPKLSKDFESKKITIANSPNSPRIKEGSYLEFRITNNGERPFYYALIDITPEGDRAVLFPAEGRQPNDYKLDVGESNQRNQFFKIAPPLGIETMKLILSDRPINFDAIRNSRGSEQELSDLEKALIGMIDTSESGNRGVQQKRNGIDISTYQYRIVPRK